MLYVGVNRRRASQAFLIFEFHDSQESYSAKYTIILSIEARGRTRKMGRKLPEHWGQKSNLSFASCYTARYSNRKLRIFFTKWRGFFRKKCEGKKMIPVFAMKGRIVDRADRQ